MSRPSAPLKPPRHAASGPSADATLPRRDHPVAQPERAARQVHTRSERRDRRVQAWCPSRGGVGPHGQLGAATRSSSTRSARRDAASEAGTAQISGHLPADRGEASLLRPGRPTRRRSFATWNSSASLLALGWASEPCTEIRALPWKLCSFLIRHLHRANCDDPSLGRSSAKSTSLQGTPAQCLARRLARLLLVHTAGHRRATAVVTSVEEALPCAPTLFGSSSGSSSAVCS